MSSALMRVSHFAVGTPLSRGYLTIVQCHRTIAAMTEHKTPVTVIGLGAMGSALASALVRAGHPTTVWNRTPRTVEGARIASSVAEAAAASPLTLVCVAGAEVSDT